MEKVNRMMWLKTRTVALAGKMVFDQQEGVEEKGNYFRGPTRCKPLAHRVSYSGESWTAGIRICDCSGYRNRTLGDSRLCIFAVKTFFSQ